MLILGVEDGDVGGATAVVANTHASGLIPGKEESVALTASVSGLATIEPT